MPYPRFKDRQGVFKGLRFFLHRGERYNSDWKRDCDKLCFNGGRLVRHPDDSSLLTAVIIDFPRNTLDHRDTFVVRPSPIPQGPARDWPINDVVEQFGGRTVILQREWIEACLKEERALCGSDNWGDWRVRPDFDLVTRRRSRERSPPVRRSFSPERGRAASPPRRRRNVSPPPRPRDISPPRRLRDASPARLRDSPRRPRDASASRRPRDATPERKRTGSDRSGPLPPPLTAFFPRERRHETTTDPSGHPPRRPAPIPMDAPKSPTLKLNIRSTWLDPPSPSTAADLPPASPGPSGSHDQSSTAAHTPTVAEEPGYALPIQEPTPPVSPEILDLPSSVFDNASSRGGSTTPCDQASEDPTLDQPDHASPSLVLDGPDAPNPVASSAQVNDVFTHGSTALEFFVLDGPSRSRIEEMITNGGGTVVELSEAIYAIQPVDISATALAAYEAYPDRPRALLFHAAWIVDSMKAGQLLASSGYMVSWKERQATLRGAD